MLLAMESTKVLKAPTYLQIAADARCKSRSIARCGVKAAFDKDQQESQNLLKSQQLDQLRNSTQ